MGLTRLGSGCNEGAVAGVEFVKLPRESLKILYCGKKENRKYVERMLTCQFLHLAKLISL